ncbi:MAG TPA: M24 family metallopeptidase [Vicinamibacterales bacterium]|nr:M24 family metallopeptidase [Vicinamibacterales bacterium]
MPRPLRALAFISLLTLAAGAHAQPVNYPDPAQRVLTHREQAPLIKGWIQKRFDTVLPQLMSRAGIDMWVIVSREYNDDPTFRSMSPLNTYSSRRRTILVFINPGGGKPVERLSIGRFDYDGLFKVVPTHNDAQYEGLAKLVAEREPKVIGINESDAWNHADGLTANEKRRLMTALGPKYTPRVKSAEMLAVGWLETKLPEELEAYRHVMKVAHMVIREAFSNKVVTPGKTTNEDVVWWMRQRVVEMGLGKWFHPSVTIHRQGGVRAGEQVIQPGDMLHTDFGIVYLGFSTDTQHNAYVLKPGETDAPAGLKEGLKAANRLQDIVMRFATVGSTGNEALAAARQLAIKEGLVPSIYCHPVGYHGHAAGPPIGMTDYQEGVPVRGDYVLQAYTWHSIELNATHKVPEWGDQAVRFALEEDAAIMPDGKWDWIDGRQTEFYLIK